MTYLCIQYNTHMRIYTTETSPEAKDEKKYISVRCPHIDTYGYVCGRQLLRLTCDGSATMEIKCPKCKSVVRVNVVGTPKSGS